jgi:hypothetical protein
MNVYVGIALLVVAVSVALPVLGYAVTTYC